MKVQRYKCKNEECDYDQQENIPFATGSRSYTHRFVKYVVELLRGMTLQDVANISYTANDATTDVVAATNKGASQAATVPLTFKHIMSRISVKLKPANASDGYDYQISKVILWAYGAGKYTLGNTTGSVGTWSDTKTYKTYSYTTGLPATTGKSNSGKVITPSQARIKEDFSFFHAKLLKSNEQYFYYYLLRQDKTLSRKQA